MFFQNPFRQEFRGSLPIGDRQLSLDFLCSPNMGRGDEAVVSWGGFPFNLSGNDADGNSKNILTLIYAVDAGNCGKFQNWSTIAVDVTTAAVSSSAVHPFEVVNALTANSEFAAVFTACVVDAKPNQAVAGVKIQSQFPITKMRFYVVNGRAESVMKFNDRAGVAELPTYFVRHTIANQYLYPDGVGLLIALDTGSVVDQNVINQAKNGKGVLLNYNYSNAQADWQLFAGRTGIFQFTNVVSGSETIVYSAGAKVGDLAMKIVTNGGNTFQLPYTLTAGDLITPP